jgi:hypothetical protein
MSSRLRSLRLASVLARVNKRKREAKKQEAAAAAQPQEKPTLRLVSSSGHEKGDGAAKRKK